jgi:hypothetical protein
VVDIDSGESFTFSVLIQPSQGTAYALSSQLYYQSQQDYNGTDSFTYRAFDSGNASVDGTALVTITAVNDAPVADTQAVTTQEDTALPITLTGSDVEGDTLSFAIASQPAHGTLTGIPPDVTYIPATDYSGSDTFTFTVNDGTLDSAPGVVRITVTPAADIWFVDRDATGSADGRSWTNAFLHPQDALEISGAGDEIWVAEGIYELRTSTDTYVLTLVDGVVLYGGFGGTETSPTQRDITTHVTTLSGQDSSTVVYGAQGAHLDGFTITGGWLSGMVNEGVSPVVANCIFENNGLVQGQDGGAIRNVSGADASITNSVFNDPGLRVLQQPVRFRRSDKKRGTQHPAPCQSVHLRRQHGQYQRRRHQQRFIRSTDRKLHLPDQYGPGERWGCRQFRRGFADRGELPFLEQFSRSVRRRLLQL